MSVSYWVTNCMDVTKTYLLIERRAQASLERTHALQRKGNTEEVNLAGEC